MALRHLKMTSAEAAADSFLLDNHGAVSFDAELIEVRRLSLMRQGDQTDADIMRDLLNTHGAYSKYANHGHMVRAFLGV